MIINQKTQVLNEENQLSIATKEQEGDIVASGGETDLTCLVGDELAVKVVNVDGEAVTTSKTSTEVLTDGNQLANNVLEQEGNVLATGGKTGLTCLMDNNQTALKTFTLSGNIVAQGDRTCLVEVDGKKQLALKILGGGDWKNKPESWPDIRENAQDGHIYLLADNRYNLGFKVTCTGGYSVDIDGTHYQDYASDAQFSMNKADWPNTGYAIDYPSGATKAHIIDIYPQSTSDITLFQCRRVAGSGREQQGVLWAHFNTVSALNLDAGFASYNSYYEPLMLAITSKNNLLNLNKLFKLGQGGDLLQYGANLEYTPTVDLSGATTNANTSFNILTSAKLEKIKLKNGAITNSFNDFAANATKLKKVILSNVTITPTSCENSFKDNYSLEELPTINYTNVTSMYRFLTNAKSLKNTVLDVSAAKSLKRIECYGSSSYFMSGFKGLRVSSQAPFNANSSQINVSYTGMERDALVTLFNDLPTVSSGQTINITGCTGTNNLTPEDVAIATNKGWTVTGAPTFDTYYAYTDSNDNTIYTKNAVANAGTFTLANASVTGALTNNAGFYSGFTQGNYLNINTSQPQTSLDLIVRASKGGYSGVFDLLKTQPDMKGILLRTSQNYVSNPTYTNCYLSSDGTSWDTLVGFDCGYDFPTDDNFHYFRIQWNSTSGVYSFSTSEDGTNWTARFSSEGGKPAPYWSGNNQTIGGNTDYTEAWTYGVVDMASTSLTIDGVKTSYGTLSGASTIYDTNLSPLSTQPRFAVSSGNIVINDVTYTRDSAKDRQG